MRTLYETDADRAAEQDIIERFIEWKQLPLTYRKLPLSWQIDYEVCLNDDPYCLCEVKSRPTTDEATMERWGEYMISASKLLSGEFLSAAYHVPYFLLVALSGVLFSIEMNPPFPTVRLGAGGRNDRDDGLDSGKCAYIPWAWFDRIG